MYVYYNNLYIYLLDDKMLVINKRVVKFFLLYLNYKWMKILECVFLMLFNIIFVFIINMKMNINFIVVFLFICDLCIVFLFSVLIFYGKVYIW